MPDITWTQVIALAPELSIVNSTAQDLILGYVNVALMSAPFGGVDSAEFALARIWLAAHLGVAAKEDAFTGQVASESAGGLARSYALPSNSGGDDYQSTSYGRKFYAMLRRSGARGGFAV